jgi:hypothetical protein
MNQNAPNGIDGMGFPYELYVVRDNNIFGVALSNGMIQILATSVIRGASCSWKDSPVPMDNARPATKKDFDDFRTQIPNGYIFPETIAA